ncbi:MAG TPA: SCP2 sterol-binding domain-containing protein, partial [Rugosibacter sp.]
MPFLPDPGMAAMTALVAAINHLLGQAAWARVKLQPFADQCAKISLPPFFIVFSITTEGLIAAAKTDAEPEVLIDLPASTPFLALQGHAAIMRAARISGSAEFAQSLGYVLQHLRWDLEEDLSKIFGDIVSHRLVAGAHIFSANQKKRAMNLAENVSEYLIEEQPTLVRR